MAKTKSKYIRGKDALDANDIIEKLSDWNTPVYVKINETILADTGFVRDNGTLVNYPQTVTLTLKQGKFQGENVTFLQVTTSHETIKE